MATKMRSSPNVYRAGKRTYFFDVKSTKSEKDYYITITESKRVGDDEYEKHKIFLYKEDFEKFREALGRDGRARADPAARTGRRSPLNPSFSALFALFPPGNGKFPGVPSDPATALSAVGESVS